MRLTLSILSHPTLCRRAPRFSIPIPHNRNRRAFAMATSTDWVARLATPSVPAYSVFTRPIEKSQGDDRNYRLIQLANGLQAMVVNDAKADKAAASMDIAVGHLSDPDDMPGLAHFCEHLLFMGTEQYPKENDYSEFLAKNNGSSNAFTATSDTNYFFSVSTAALAPSLSRFSCFFHSPLFSPSCTSRELNAVDSEHKKNHQSDIWRIFQLNKELSKEGHVWSKFGSGNRESLSMAGKELKVKGKLNGVGNGNGIVYVNGRLSSSNASSHNNSLSSTPIPSRMGSPAPSMASSASEIEADGGTVGRETRRRLVEWWTREYCASRMRLCVIGKESLDELADLVSSLFSPILNRGCDPLPMITDHPFGPNEMGTLVSVQTIMSFHAIELSFPLVYQPPMWRYKPASFIAHLVGHEGPGSLLSYLKKQGWVTSLSTSSQTLARGFAMFKTTIYLTLDGFHNHRAVQLAVFKYLSLLRSSPLPSWYQQEIATISSIRFRFQEKRRPDDYAVWISEHMAWPVPREKVISAPNLVWPWDEGGENGGGGEKEMREILDGLRVGVGRAVLMARAEEHERICPSKEEGEWKKVPWYGTEYRVVRFDEEFIKEAEKPNDIPDLFLPGPNMFIPTNLEVDKREVVEPLKRPHLIRETAQSIVWHKKDDQFWVPKAHVFMEIRSPTVLESPRTTVLTSLFADLVNDALTEFSYDADLAGLAYGFSSTTMGLIVTLKGYNDKLNLLAKHVLEKARGLQVDGERLAVMKEQKKRDWENIFLEQTYKVSDYYGRYLLSEWGWTYEEKLREVSSVTAEEVQAHVKRLFEKVHIRMLITGNLYKDEAISISDMTENILGAVPLSATEVLDRALLLPEGTNLIWTTPAPNPNEPNSALTYYVHLGSMTSQPLRVASAFLTQILSEPTFNVLRTQEQLGYIVSCSQWTLAGLGHAGLRIVVQSERGPSYLEERVEAFLDGMKTTIEEMPIEEFEEQKAGLTRKWREASKNLLEETNKYWSHIDSGYLDFLRRDNDANELQRVTKQDVLDLFLARVHPSASRRSKLSVHVLSQKPRPKRISIAAAEAFESHVRSVGALVPDDAAWKDDSGGDQPLLADFVKYFQGVLVEDNWAPEATKELLLKIPSFMDKYPAEGENDDATREGATYIQDVKAFKASLAVSEDPKPLVEWSDLPISKF